MTSANSTAEYVDTSRFPTEAGVNGPNGRDISLNVKDGVEALLAAGRKNKSYRKGDTYGILVVRPFRSRLDFLEAWHRDPYSVVWFTIGDPRYVANVFRKLLAAVKTGVRDTLLLHLRGTDLVSVDSVDAAGRFPMGPFPFGGFMFISLGELQSGGGLSVLDQHDDPGPGAYATYLALGQLYQVDPRELDKVLIN